MNVYSVSQVNRYVHNLFAQDFVLNRISVRGEVSNCTYHRSGHIYFTLKDAAASLSCVMFAGNRGGLAFRMKDGDKVTVSGSVDVYEKEGRYQLYAKQITLEGAGLLYEKFLALKAALAEMGMFAEEYKQPIPYYAKRIGIVTAPTGAAIQDIRKIALRRNPYVQLILYPALVQGEGAVPSIVEGIETLDALGLDVLIVGRGGGSIEDLWAFNEEAVARAVFACRTPVISAVGHETDTTIIDYVADLRAPTPSAAAELAVTPISDILEHLKQTQRRLELTMQRRLSECRASLILRQNQWRILSPQHKLEDKKQHLADLEQKLTALAERNLIEAKRKTEGLEQRIRLAAGQNLKAARHRLELKVQIFKGLSPLDRLNQGFSYTETEEGRAVTSIRQVGPGQRLTLQLKDGCVRTRAEEIVAHDR